MDRRLPPRVTYWTGVWDPAKEAISKEIDALRVGDRATAPVVAIAPGQRNRLLARDRVLTLSAASWPILRVAARLLEPTGDITHVFGGQRSWHLLRALGRRPILLTAVIPRESQERLPGRDMARVVVETEGSVSEWLEAGIPAERISLVRPGVDLSWFAPEPPPTGRFGLLFASTPADPAEFHGRGISMLVHLARARPDIDVLIPWRQWGDMDASRRALGALRPPPNFMVHHGLHVDMRQFYARTHATVACFAPGVGKACPNFVLEGLAAGRPCVTTPDLPAATLLARGGAAVLVEGGVEGLSAGVDRVQGAWSDYSRAARQLAEEQFDIRQFRASYEQIYGEMLAQERATRRRRASGERARGEPGC